MNESRLYRELVAWLRSRHPFVLAEWEREQGRQSHKPAGDTSLSSTVASEPSGKTIDQLSPTASVSEITQAIQRELASLGIAGGIPGVNQEGVPCVHLVTKGLYGQAYEESVTLARLRDTGYRRHLRHTFG